MNEDSFKFLHWNGQVDNDVIQKIWTKKKEDLGRTGELILSRIYCAVQIDIQEAIKKMDLCFSYLTQKHRFGRN